MHVRDRGAGAIVGLAIALLDKLNIREAIVIGHSAGAEIGAALAGLDQAGVIQGRSRGKLRIGRTVAGFRAHRILDDATGGEGQGEHHEQRQGLSHGSVVSHGCSSSSSSCVRIRVRPNPNENYQLRSGSYQA